ncbi:MAG: tRNA dihydrouridine synthase [Promethearchaeota archaeon]
MNIFHDNPGKNLFLAPLQNVTTGPFRNFCKEFFDIGLVCTPMLYIKRLSKSPKSIKHELHGIEKESPVSVQLIGNDPSDLIKSIEFLESYKYDFLDINAGCPSKRAINSKEGGYLVKDLKTLSQLLAVAIKHSSRPVSLKTRIGFDDTFNIQDLSKIVNDSGIAFITIHARSVLNRFDNKKLDLEKVKRLKNDLEIPLVGNGDILGPISAKNYIEQTGVDALMIGRGAMGYPQVFRDIYDYLINLKLRPFSKNNSCLKHYFKIYEKKVDEFIEGISLRYPSEHYKLAELKRNAIWFTKHLENSSVIRAELRKAKSIQQLKKTIDLYSQT